PHFALGLQARFAAGPGDGDTRNLLSHDARSLLVANEGCAQHTLKAIVLRTFKPTSRAVSRRGRPHRALPRRTRSRLPGPAHAVLRVRAEAPAMTTIAPLTIEVPDDEQAW